MSIFTCANGCRRIPMAWREGLGLCRECAIKANWNIVVIVEGEKPRETVAQRIAALQQEYLIEIAGLSEYEVIGTTPFDSKASWIVNGQTSEVPF